MQGTIEQSPASLSSEYLPVAVFYEEADLVEYVRADVPAVHRRVDEFLTLVLDMEKREPIGFALKGFRNFYLTELKPKLDLTEADFLSLTAILEDVISAVGDSIFDDTERRKAYETAQRIAAHDDVELREFPEAA